MNYDPSTNLYWYRKVDGHPHAGVNSLAQAFRNEVASWVGMRPPCIFWFEEAEFGPAKHAWAASPSYGKPQEADPLRDDSCEYFRWRKDDGCEGAAGYTHYNSPLGIMINRRCAGKGLLDAVAEECFHMYQDVEHRTGWRKNANAEAEREAKEWVRSKEGEIRDFLEAWERRSPN